MKIKECPQCGEKTFRKMTATECKDAEMHWAVAGEVPTKYLICDECGYEE